MGEELKPWEVAAQQAGKKPWEVAAESSQKKSPDQSSPANTSTNSNDASSQGGGQQGQNGYEWSNGQQNQQLTGGVEQQNAQNLNPNLPLPVAQKVGAKSPSVYVAEKGNDIVQAQGDIEQHNTNLQNFDQSQNFTDYLQLRKQLEAADPKTPGYAELEQKVKEAKDKPFDLNLATWSDMDKTQKQLKEERLPKDMQGLETVEQAADFYDKTNAKQKALADKINNSIKDVSDVVQPLQAQAGIKLDKDGYHELGVWPSLMSGVFQTVDNVANSAALIGASDEKRNNIYKNAIGQQVIDPAKPEGVIAEGAQTVGSLAPYFTPGLGTVGSAVSAGVMMGMNNKFQAGVEAYKSILAKTNDEKQALAGADAAGNTAGAIGLATGAVGLPLAGKLGEHIALSALSKEAVETALKDGGLNLSNLSLPEYLAYNLPKQAVQASPFALGKIVENKFAQARGENVGTMDDVASQFMGAMLLGHMIDGLTYGYAKLSPTVKEVYQNAIAKYGNEPFQMGMEKAVTDGQMTQDQADAIAKPIQDKALAYAEMPQDLSPEMEKKVLPLIQEKQKLLETQAENKGMPDEHFTGQLEAIDRKISETMGTPLTLDERARMADLKAQAKEDGKLSRLDRDELNHYEKRIDNGTENVDKTASPDNQVSGGKKNGETTEGDNLATETTHVAPHGDTKNDKADKISGRNEEPLSEPGRKQAETTGQQFKQDWDKANAPEGERVVMVSPLNRAQQTGEIVAKESGATVKTDPNLTAWDIKDFGGATNEEFAPVKAWFAEHPDATKYEPENKDAAHYGKEIGESVNDLGIRMEQVNDMRLRGHGGYTPDAKIITHGENRQMLDAIDKNGGKYDENALKLFAESKRPDDIFLSKPKGEVKAEPKTEPVEPKNDEGKTAGISNRVMQQTAERLGITAPESGHVLDPEQSKEFGRQLLKEGADPQKVIDDFNKDKKIGIPEMAIVGAHEEALLKAHDAAADKYGINSVEAKEAAQKVADWQKAVQLMKTAWSGIGQGLQGETDINTGSFTGLKRAFELQKGSEATPQETAKIKQLSDEVNNLNKKYEDALKEITAAHDEAAKAQEEHEQKVSEILAGQKGKYATKAKEVADKIRTLKSKPFTFTDSNGNQIEFKQNSILPYNEIVEAVAKGIEAGGKLADAVINALDKYKNEDWYKNLSAQDRDKLADQLAAHLSPDEKQDIHTQFINKADNNFTPKESKAIWDYAKQAYLDKGRTAQDMIRGVAMDLGLTQKQVAEAISLPKTQRTTTNDMYLAQRNRLKAIQSAKNYVEKANEGYVGKFLNAVGKLWAVPRAIFTAGHGTVAPFTHAGADFFNPLHWKSYFNFMFQSYKSAYGASLKKGGIAEFEQRVSNFTHDPMYAFGLRSGLDIDPLKKDNDYAPAADLLGKLSKIGDRGFFELKPYRLEKFKQEWGSLSEAQKADPNTAKNLAAMINNSTGTNAITNQLDPKLKSFLGGAIFAPKLVASQIARLTTEPGRAVITMAKAAAGEATPAETAALKVFSKNTGAMLATYAGALAVNAGMLSAFGSKQQINWTDSKKSDWLRLKGFNHTFDLTGGMLPMFKFIEHMVQVPFMLTKEVHNDRQGKLADVAIKEARGKLSPAAGIIFDFTTHKDFDKNVLPPFDDKITAKGRAYGEHKMSWYEYAGKHFTPIPVQEAVRNVAQQMKTDGVSDYNTNQILNGIMMGGLTGLSGARIGDEPKPKK